jgi:hypothetical protein
VKHQKQMEGFVDNDEPYLPLELIAFHIFPHAFDTPREAASLSLVCRFVHECQLLRRGSFWMAWLERQRDALLEYVRNELRLPDEQTAFEGLKACIESRFNATPLLSLGIDGAVRSVACANENRTGFVAGKGKKIFFFFFFFFRRRCYFLLRHSFFRCMDKAFDSPRTL